MLALLAVGSSVSANAQPYVAPYGEEVFETSISLNSEKFRFVAEDTFVESGYIWINYDVYRWPADGGSPVKISGVETGLSSFRFRIKNSSAHFWGAMSMLLAGRGRGDSGNVMRFGLALSEEALPLLKFFPLGYVSGTNVGQILRQVVADWNVELIEMGIDRKLRIWLHQRDGTEYFVIGPGRDGPKLTPREWITLSNGATTEKYE